MAEPILPRNLPAASVVPGDAAIIIDTGSAIQKADPLKVVDAAAPIASQSDAETGSDNVKRMTPLRVKQAIDTLGVSAAALASTDPGKGAAMVAVQGGGTLADASPFVVRPASGTDISAALTAAIALANGKRIVIPPGTWTAKNVNVTGATIEWEAGAKLTATLGANDNMLYSYGGTRLIRPVLEIANSAVPPHGGLGNGVMFGTFVNAGEIYHGLEIVDGTFISLNAPAYGLAISCLGRCENVRLVGKTRIIGRFSAGFQAHWGGIFDINNPHYAFVDESFHPNNIRIDTLSLERGGPHNAIGYLGFSLSAAYDVQVKSILCEGWNRTVWVQPGDVYDLVTTEDQKDKILSGIKVDYIEVINPPPLVGTYNNILLSGLSATIRVTGQEELVCAADRQNMRVDLGQVRFLCRDGHTYDAIPLARMIYAKNSKMDISFEGFDHLDAASTGLFQTVMSTDCEIRASMTSASSADTARLLDGYGNVRNRYVLDYVNAALPSNMPTTHRAISLGRAGGTATVGAAVTAGDTSITISGWSGTAIGYTVKGTRLYTSDGSYVALSRSQNIGTGITSIAIERSPVDIANGATLSVTCKELDSVVSGTIEGAFIAAELTNVDGVSVPATCTYSGKNDVLLSGAINRRVLVNGYYARCGSAAPGALTTANVHLGEAGVLSEFFSAVGATFEQSANPMVAHNIYGRVTSNAHIGLLVTGCKLNSSGVPVNYLWPTDGSILDRGPPQVFGNRRFGAMAGTQYDFDIGQGATMQAGAAYHIWRTNLPGSGNWPTTSRWHNPAVAAGVSPGSVRSAAGSWVAEPVL